MDTVSCLPGYASDHVFLYGDDFAPGSCNVSLVFYVIFFTCLTGLRGVVLVVQFEVWVERQRAKRKKNPLGKTKPRRISWNVLLSFLSFLALLCFTILSSLNVANASNGGTGFLLGLLYFPLSMQAVLLLIRVVRLGQRLVPASRLPIVDQNSMIAERLSQLSHMTIITWFVHYSNIIASILPLLAFFAGLFRPVYATFQVGAFAYAWQDVFLGLGIAYQHERIIRVIQECSKVALPSAVQSEKQRLDGIIRRVRVHQGINCVLGPTVATVWLLNVSNALLPSYGFAMTYFALETLVTASLLLSHIPRHWFARCCKRAVKEDQPGEADGPVSDMISSGKPS